jgi:hypothetical protein
MERNKLQKLAVSMAVGTAVFAYGAPANLNAITAANPYEEASFFANAAASPSLRANLALEKQAVSIATVIAAQSAGIPERLLDKLAYCESSGNPKALNPNDAGSPSYGLYQYKAATWKTYLAKYGLTPATGAPLDHIYDASLQKELTRRILEDEVDGWKHWQTCSRKVGLDQY